MSDDGICADDRVIAYRHAAQNDGVGTQHHVIAEDRGRPRSGIGTGWVAEGDALVDAATAAHHHARADDDATRVDQ
jgi:hypothetical protein